MRKVLSILALTITLAGCNQSPQLAGFNYSAKTLAIHKNMGTGITTIGNAYAIITDIDTLDMMDRSTGLPNATYAECACTFAADGQNTDWGIATVPALASTKRYAIAIYDNGGSTAAAGNTCLVGPLLFDPESAMLYTDTNPSMDGRVRIRNH